MEIKGSCVCGAVQLVASIEGQNIDACHCTTCRKWGGGPLLAVESNAVDFTNSDQIAIYNSSEWAERGFCRNCGTHLFYRLKQVTHYALPVGLFDDMDKWTLKQQIFIDHKPAFYSFAQKTEDLTGDEVFAKFSAG